LAEENIESESGASLLQGPFTARALGRRPVRTEWLVERASLAEALRESAVSAGVERVRSR